MKSKHIIILLIISISIFLANKFLYTNTNTLTNYLIDTTSETETINKFNIYIYNKSNQNFENISLNTNISDLDESDYIQEIIKHMPFYNSSYKFLATYNLNKNNKEILIIKLNYEFYKLSKENMDILIKSLNKTLLSNFKIDEIIIEIDSN